MVKKTIYEKFLALCGCETEQNVCELLEKTCKRWSISEEELEYACTTHIPKYYKIQYQSIRRLLGLYIKEWMYLESLWTKQCKKLYYNVPGTVSGMIWIKECMNNEIYVGSPDLVCMIVLYGIIGIKTKIENSSCRHCAVNLMRIKQSDEKLIPIPDIRWSNGLLCDEAMKADSILQETETNAKYIYLCKAAKFEYPSTYMETKIEKIFLELKEEYGIEFKLSTFETIRKKRFLLAMKIEQIIQMINKEKKFLIGNTELALLETMLLTNFIDGLDGMINIVSEIYNDIKKRKGDKKITEITQKYAIYYTPVCNPEYSKIFEDNQIGLLVQVAFKSKGILKQNKSWIEEIAEECLGMDIGLPAEKEAYNISKTIKQYQLNGLILGMFTFDRWLGAHQNILKEIVEKETGKRVFIYETDFWNQETFTNDRMKTAVETLKCSEEWGESYEDYI